MSKINSTGEFPPIKGPNDAAALGAALLGLPLATTLKLKSVLAALSECLAQAKEASGSILRRAVCRADEVYFDIPSAEPES